MAGLVRKVLFGLVLEDAIMREENAYRFYEHALEGVGDEEVRPLLKKLCAEELRHRLKLEELQRRGEIEQIRLSGRQEIELLEEEQAWPVLPAGSSSRDVLNLALIKEKQAVRYYQLIGGRAALKTVRALFLLLAGEESAHILWVEKMLAEL